MITINGTIKLVLEQDQHEKLLKVLSDNIWYDVTIKNARYNKDTKGFEEDPALAEKADELCLEHLGVPFAELESLKGQDITVYVTDNGWSYAWPMDYPIPFDHEVAPFETTVDEVESTDEKLILHFKDLDGIHRAYEYKYISWVDMNGKREPVIQGDKRIRQRQKFEKAFGVKFEDCQEAVGREIEIAVGKQTYNDKEYFFPEIKVLNRSGGGNITDTTQDLTAEAVNNGQTPFDEPIDDEFGS